MAHNHLHRTHKRVANPEPKDDTVVSIVYVTASPTFTGEIGGYTTLGVAIDTSKSPQPTTSATSTPKAKTSSSPKIQADTSSSAKSTKHTTLATSASTSALPTVISAPSTSLGTSLALLAATGGISSSSTTKSAAVSSATSESSTSGTSEGGMSAGGKAGLAIGILLLVGAVLSIILFCFKKRRNAAKEAEARENEKYANVTQRAASVRTTATAPRLSLRPITQFLPNLAEKRQSRGNPLGAHLAPVAAPQQEKGSAWDRPMTANSNSTENPFGNHAETIPAQNPFGNHAETIDATNARGAEEVNVPAVAAVAAPLLAPVGLKRGASKRENGPPPMDFTKSGPLMAYGPPSPAGTEFSVSSAAPGTPVQTGSGAAIAAAGGPVNSAVHRVQLDFNPSMEDELELKQGQLIRVLHEYDDGWALCIRLDRSQQGVVPRTCLSTRPVKPRPMQGGPGPRGPPPPGMRGPGPQGRPQSPAMNGQRMAPGPLQIRPSTPNGQQFRPASPAGSMQQRPQSPSGSMRSMNPQQGRARSNSSAQMQAPRIAQAGPSPMNPMPQYDGAGSSPPQGAPIRKPVPGQAL